MKLKIVNDHTISIVDTRILSNEASSIVKTQKGYIDEKIKWYSECLIEDWDEDRIRPSIVFKESINNTIELEMSLIIDLSKVDNELDTWCIENMLCQAIEACLDPFVKEIEDKAKQA